MLVIKKVKKKNTYILRRSTESVVQTVGHETCQKKQTNKNTKTKAQYKTGQIYRCRYQSPV
jgi:hypothetical protein